MRVLLFLLLEDTKTITRTKNIEGTDFFTDTLTTPFPTNSRVHLTQHDTQSHLSGNKSAKTKTQIFEYTYKN